MYQAFVGINYLLQVDALINIVCEGSNLVEFFVSIDNLFDWLVGFNYLCDKDSTGEVTAIRDEVDAHIISAVLSEGRAYLWRACWSYLVEALAHLVQVLVGERFVYAQVVVAPREMGCGTGLLTCSCATGNTVDHYVVIDESHLGGRQQA